MSYTKITNFAAKDALVTGNPSKAVRGAELDAEFSAIAVADALNLKSNNAAAVVAAIGSTPVANATHATNADNATNATSAISATTATSVPWSGVSSHPTNLSQFTNDLGNYGGWITGAGSCAYATSSGSAGSVSNGVYTTDFGNSLATSGYQRLPGGLIIQWGIVSVGPTTSVAVTYPISFSSATYSANLTMNTTTAYTSSITISSYSASQLVIKNNNGGAAMNINWFAIGV